MKHEFKVDDNVRVVRRGAIEEGWSIAMDKTVGEVGVIERIAGDCLPPHLRIHFPQFDEHWYYKPEWVELVGSTDNPPFKKGDKVRIVKQRENCFGHSPVHLDSTVYTIIDDDKSELPYRLISAGGATWWCTAEQLELAEPVAESAPSLSSPMPTIGYDASSAIAAVMDSVRDLFAPSSSAQSTKNIPLIESTKLLTDIKLD